MSGKIWVYSDPHFHHKNIVKFENFDGTKVRPWDDVEVMNEEMIGWYMMVLIALPILLVLTLARAQP